MITLKHVEKARNKWFRIGMYFGILVTILFIYTAQTICVAYERFIARLQ